MKIGVLGTGQVGSAIGHKLASLGHDVVLGSRNPAAKAAAPARTEPAPLPSSAQVRIATMPLAIAWRTPPATTRLVQPMDAPLVFAIKELVAV